MSQALYPSDRVTWCIYALFKEDQAAIDKQCVYNFEKKDWKSSSQFRGIFVGHKLSSNQEITGEMFEGDTYFGNKTPTANSTNW